MRAVTFCLLCFLATGTGSATSLSPITRVVELLRGLAVTVEKDGKKEEDMYESFVCWGKSVIAQKTATNEAGATKIETLETYIADLAAGRITLSSERADLEKDIAQLFKDLEEAKALREKEEADFKDAEHEMNQAITALASAMEVLDDATKDHKEGVLLTMHARLNNKVESYAQHLQNLKHAVALGEKFLGKADATFLRRLLTADVPKPDWKKLNRKATFKMSYKARSFKIQDVLKKMHGTFTANLNEATEAEGEAQANYDKLSQAKKEQLTTAQQALQKEEVENGERGASKEEAAAEVVSLKKQIEDDERFIKETQHSLDTKKEEWKVRSQLRTGEIAAISKAINILHNDDSRDNFKKSLESQESFLQVSSSSSAASALRAAARKSGDARLMKLATLIKDSPKKAFEPVIAAIDKMMSQLSEEEEKDLEIKEECEKGRMEDTREAAVTSREIDDMTDDMTKLTDEVAQIVKDIAAMEAKKLQTHKELEEAQTLRTDEHSAWMQSDKDDTEAAITVNNAKEVLEGFYKDNNLNFIQKSKAPEVTAGAAPPPPPATWDGGYGGKTGESQGISAILEMVHADIIKDQEKGKAEEDEAEAAFIKLEKDSKDEMEALTNSIEEQDGVKGDKETDKVNIEGERRTKKGSLDAVLTKMREISPNCEYFSVHYAVRRTNRAIEMDGLQKAKAILMGGQFSKGPDPNREMKPGDAFLQRRAA